MPLIFSKTAPSYQQSVKDTGIQQQRSRKNSSATLRAYKRRLLSSNQQAWTSDEANEKKKKILDFSLRIYNKVKIKYSIRSGQFNKPHNVGLLCILFRLFGQESEFP